ncbi:MAG TPA: M3 family metallopeptidase [Candidatus Limnocylindrales bacterium]|jgi:thimet oligopeptidase|nr:M3 family metallopeptidase [Candidatus Limnocylindrales bacterium]
MLYDYSRVTAETVSSEVERLLGAAEARLGELTVGPDQRTYDNTLRLLDEAVGQAWLAFGRSAFMARVHTDAEVRDAGQAAEERLTKWQVDLAFRPELAAAVRAFAETAEARALEGERRRLLDHWLRDFRRAGHDLSDEQRREVQRLRERLVELEVLFQRNVDEYEDGLELTRDELAGMDEDYIARLRPGERAGTYRVSMDYPELFPFLDQAERRDLRQQIEHKALNRAAEQNRPLLEEILALRRRVAELLGYASWAHFALEVKMAARPEQVDAFYAGLLRPLQAKGHEEIERMARLLEAETGDSTLRSWDRRYYDEQIRRREFGIDTAEVAAHFPLEATVAGMFELCGEVFGLAFEQLPATSAWHPDVYLYAIRDRASGEHIAHFYADLFPRSGKFGHAAAFTLVPGHRSADGSRQAPVSAIVANFTKPAVDSPSLLRHDEVLTLFHEFGHILHQCLSQAETIRFSGTETEGDFVEAPSQIMEHWAWNAEVLSRFARHHRTGEAIPAEMVRQLAAARDLNVCVKTLRQCYYGLLDRALHGPQQERDLERIYREAWEVTGFPFPEGTFDPASFAHLVGGYDAGYYGYLWSKVYGDDMYSRFEAEGVTSPAVGADYRREILERGGSRDGMEHLRAFLGREPSDEAFLRLLGIEKAVATP